VTDIRPLTILGSGMALPENSLSSDVLDARIGRPAGWLYRRSGVRQRYVCGEEDQIDLAVTAAQAALSDAGITADEVELILFAAAVPYQSIPSTAPLIQKRLAIPDGGCMAFDVNSTCLSFLTALDVVSHMIGSRKALVIASEVASRGLPWTDDPVTAALFGDGAAAVLLTAAGEGRILASRMETYPSAYEACSLASGGTRFDYHADRDNFDRHSLFRMDGDALFKLTVRHFEPFLDRLLAEAGWQRDEVELVVPHQASPGALAHLARRCGFPPDIIVNIVSDYGNQIAASIPTALHLARQRHPKGTRTLLLGTSAGVSLGGMALIL
jgi:3-oxoacyl-[acyl-carrier-protein] synthase-3